MKSPRVRAVSAALDTGIEWQEYAAGAEYAAKSGELIAPGALDAIEACGWAPGDPTATPPIGKGFRSINVQLRQRFFHLRKPAPCAHAAGRTHPL